MKKITMFMFEGCPHCKKAKEMMAKLLELRPEYREVPFEMIDEKKNPEIAEKYDYYYVPTFFVGDDKIAEGVPSEAKIEEVFKKAFDR